jgi:hypothetical protein
MLRDFLCPGMLECSKIVISRLRRSGCARTHMCSETHSSLSVGFRQRHLLHIGGWTDDRLGYWKDLRQEQVKLVGCEFSQKGTLGISFSNARR